MLEVTDRLIYPFAEIPQNDGDTTIDQIYLDQLFIYLDKVYVKRMQNLHFSTIEVIAFRRCGVWFGKSKAFKEVIPNDTRVTIFSPSTQGKVS